MPTKNTLLGTPVNPNTLPLIIAFLTVAACSSDDSQINVEPEPLFAGTVSTPQLAEQTVFLKSPTGEITTVGIDAEGVFTVPDAMTDDQYLMRVDLGNDNYLYSIAHLLEQEGNRQNIHSYTDLTARTWFADQQLDINSVFTSAAGIDNFPPVESVNSIDTNLQAVVSSVLEVYGLESVNLSNANYLASDTGIDRFLNENPVIIKGTRATIIVNDPQTNIQSIAVNQVALQTTFSDIDITPPQQPLGLRAMGTGDNEIVLAWTITTDNVGIATYEIFRDDTPIANTPFPVYRDSGLLPETDYSYTVVARDESGNLSLPSAASIARVLEAPDTEAPDVPSQVTLEPDTQSIQLFWSHSNIGELVSFEVTRTSEDGLLIREVTSPRLNDLVVASGTEYCYTIVAVDASENRSEANDIACSTTSGAAVVEPVETDALATISMAQESVSGTEGEVISVFVNREGDPTGEISIDYTIAPGTAFADEDYIAAGGTLVWTDGDVVARQIDIELLQDNLVEDTETLSVVLTNSSTNAVVSQASTSVIIFDN